MRRMAERSLRDGIGNRGHVPSVDHFNARRPKLKALAKCYRLLGVGNFPA